MKRNALLALFSCAVLAVLAPTISLLMDIASVKVVRLANAAEENARYSEIYEIGSCVVGVRKDGTGVDVAAIDKEWRSDYALMQAITITKDAKNEVRANAEYRMIPRVEELFPITIESAYDVFYKHCREDALWLPAEVKKFFFGQYGIN